MLIDGGLSIEITGEGRVFESIRRIVVAHAPTPDGLPDFAAEATAVATGMRLTVLAENPFVQRAPLRQAHSPQARRLT